MAAHAVAATSTDKKTDVIDFKCVPNVWLDAKLDVSVGIVVYLVGRLRCVLREASKPVHSGHTVLALGAE